MGPSPCRLERVHSARDDQPLTQMQKQAIVTTTVGGAMLLILMIILAPVGA